MTRAIMNGCNGKMGQCITGICAQDPDIEIVAGIDTYDGIKNDYPVFKSLADCDVEADVIIDFSNAKAVDALIDHCVEKQIPVVLCTTYKYDRSQERKKRDPYEIGISAVRGGNIVGEHEVIFAGQDEVIEFKHTAYSKAVFAKGAVEAAKFLHGKGAGHYDMADVIAAK